MSFTSSAMRIFGMDLGTDSSLFALSGKAGVDVLVTEVGDRSIPSVLTFTDRQRYVGDSSLALSRPNLTVSNAKRLLGLPYDSEAAHRELRFTSAPHHAAEDGTTEFSLTQDLRVEQLLGALFYRARQIVEFATEAELKAYMPVTEAVVAVPSFFTDSQKARLRAAAAIAGVTLTSVMNDVTAAALDYGLFRTGGIAENSPPRLVAIVSLGASSTTAGIISFSRGHFDVLGHAFDDQLGGRDFDAALYEHFAEKTRQKFRIDPSSQRKARVRLLAACQKLKTQLSAGELAPLAIECLMDDVDISFPPFSRDEFQELVAPLLVRLTSLVQRLFKTSGLSPADLHSVEVIGGTSRIPAVQKTLSAAFNSDLSHTLNASETIARGCAIMGAILNPSKHVPYSFSDCSAHPIGFGLPLTNSVPRPLNNLPSARWPVPFPLASPSAEEEIGLAYADSSFFSAGWPEPERLLGEFIARPQADGGEEDPLEAQITVDSEGFIVVSTASKRVTVEAKGRAPRSLEKSLPVESWKHAEEKMLEADKALSRALEAKNQLESLIFETLPHVRDDDTKHALYSRLDPSDRKYLASVLQEVERWLCDEHDTAEPSEFVQRHKEAKGLHDQLLKPFIEEQKRKELRAEASSVLNHLNDTIVETEQWLAANKGYLVPADVEAATTLLQTKKEWADKALTEGEASDQLLADLRKAVAEVDKEHSALIYKRKLAAKDAAKAEEQKAEEGPAEVLALEDATSVPPPAANQE